jgi:hypothetical protein
MDLTLYSVQSLLLEEVEVERLVALTVSQEVLAVELLEDSPLLDLEIHLQQAHLKVTTVGRVAPPAVLITLLLEVEEVLELSVLMELLAFQAPEEAVVLHR